jgi:hypothetical protein
MLAPTATGPALRAVADLLLADPRHALVRGAVAGLPGLLAYRAVTTLDANGGAPAAAVGVVAASAVRSPCNGR